jgi:hypothetical protein
LTHEQNVYPLFGKPISESGFDSTKATSGLDPSITAYSDPIRGQQQEMVNCHVMDCHLLCLDALEGLLLTARRIYTHRIPKGNHPKELSKLNIVGPFDKLPDLVDPWGDPYAYVWLPSGYLLYSKGIDRLDGTADDIASEDVSRCWREPYREQLMGGNTPDRQAKVPPPVTFRTTSSGSCGIDPALPCERAWNVMDELRRGVELIREMSGRYPVALSDLNSAGVWIFPVLEDPWGQEYVYRRTDTGYELYSSGKDKRAHTEDDLVVGFDRDICKQSPYLDEAIGDKGDSQPSSSAKNSGCGCSFVGR